MVNLGYEARDTRTPRLGQRRLVRGDDAVHHLVVLGVDGPAGRIGVVVGHDLRCALVEGNGGVVFLIAQSPNLGVA